MVAIINNMISNWVRKLRLLLLRLRQVDIVDRFIQFRLLAGFGLATEDKKHKRSV